MRILTNYSFVFCVVLFFLSCSKTDLTYQNENSHLSEQIKQEEIKSVSSQPIAPTTSAVSKVSDSVMDNNNAKAEVQKSTEIIKPLSKHKDKETLLSENKNQANRFHTEAISTSSNKTNTVPEKNNLKTIPTMPVNSDSKDLSPPNKAHEVTTLEKGSKVKNDTITNKRSIALTFWKKFRQLPLTLQIILTVAMAGLLIFAIASIPVHIYNKYDYNIFCNTNVRIYGGILAICVLFLILMLIIKAHEQSPEQLRSKLVSNGIIVGIIVISLILTVFYFTWKNTTFLCALVGLLYQIIGCTLIAVFWVLSRILAILGPVFEAGLVIGVMSEFFERLNRRR